MRLVAARRTVPLRAVGAHLYQGTIRLVLRDFTKCQLGIAREVREPIGDVRKELGDSLLEQVKCRLRKSLHISHAIGTARSDDDRLNLCSGYRDA